MGLTTPPQPVGEQGVSRHPSAIVTGRCCKGQDKVSNNKRQHRQQEATQTARGDTAHMRVNLDRPAQRTGVTAYLLWVAMTTAARSRRVYLGRPARGTGVVAQSLWVAMTMAAIPGECTWAGLHKVLVVFYAVSAVCKQDSARRVAGQPCDVLDVDPRVLDCDACSRAYAYGEPATQMQTSMACLPVVVKAPCTCSSGVFVQHMGLLAW